MPQNSTRTSLSYRLFKLVFDCGFALVLIPVLVTAATLLFVLNPLMNPGPLLFSQKRMGRSGKPFKVYKFRSMLCANDTFRGPDDPLETDRITKLGRFMRRYRIDELPQIVNVLLGDMSFIGPRPDMYEHGLSYIETVPGYRRRLSVKPGITGLAQTEVGYAEGVAGTRRKALADIKYIARRSIKLDLWILGRTVLTVIGSTGR